MNITFSPPNWGECMTITEAQLRTIGECLLGNWSEAEVVGHAPSPIVELILDPDARSTVFYRHHINDDGTIGLTEATEVVDGDYNWEPV